MLLPRADARALGAGKALRAPVLARVAKLVAAAAGHGQAGSAAGPRRECCKGGTGVEMKSKTVWFPHRHLFRNSRGQVEKRWFWPGQRVGIVTVRVRPELGFLAVLYWPALLLAAFLPAEDRKAYVLP